MAHNAGIGIAASPIAATEKGLSVSAAAQKVVGGIGIAGAPVAANLSHTASAVIARAPVMGGGCIAGAPIAGAPLAGGHAANTVVVPPVVAPAEPAGRTASGAAGGIHNVNPFELGKKKRRPKKLDVDLGLFERQQQPGPLDRLLERLFRPDDFVAPVIAKPTESFSDKPLEQYVSSDALLSRLVENLPPVLTAVTAAAGVARPSKPQTATVREATPLRLVAKATVQPVAPPEPEINLDDEAAVALILALAA